MPFLSSSLSLRARFMLVSSIGIVALVVCASLALGWTTSRGMEDRLQAISAHELDSAQALVLNVMEQRAQYPDDPDNGPMGVFDKWFAARNTKYPGKLWSVWGPTTAAYMATQKSSEPSEPPRDDIDVEAMRSGKPVGRFVGDIYRYSTPIVLGVTNGTSRKLCTTCHAALMGTSKGGVIGVFSSSLSTKAAIHQFWFTIAIIAALLLLAGGAMLLALWMIFDRVVTKPVRKITETMGCLTKGDLDVAVPFVNQIDEVGDMAKAVTVFKRNLIQNRKLLCQIETANKKLELSGAELNNALAAANAASQAKSQFLATMSHELRTPLNAIIGFSEIQKEQLFGPMGNDTYRRYAEDIFNSGNHLLQLINDILDFAKSDANQLKLHDDTVDLNEIASACIRFVKPQAEQSKTEISVVLEHGLPQLRADALRVRQIVINLLSNAVKFTPDGGKISVTTASRNGGLAVAVADTGIGIAAEDIPIALSRFGQVDRRLSRKYAGTGLGLPLAKHLAELHSGTLAIESTVNIGTTVTVWFPPERVIARSANWHADSPPIGAQTG